MNLKKQISKTGSDGLCQINVRVDVSRTNRPRLKTGIFIHPELWDESKERIKLPKRGRASAGSLEEATRAELKLNAYCLTLSQLINAATGIIEVNKAFIDRVFSLMNAGFLTKIDSYADIEEAETRLKASKRSSSGIQNPFAEEESEEADATDHTLLKSYESTDFYRLILLYCKRHNLAESREKCYRVLARQLRRFELYIQATSSSLFSLSYDDMTNDDVENFRIYLRDEHRLVKRYPRLYKKIFAEAPQTESKKFKTIKVEERSNNYITSLLKKLATVFHWLQETGATANDPFKGFDFGSVLYGHPIYIKKEERNLIAEYDLSDEPLITQQQRDIFIFQSLVGCRVGDLLTLTEANISGDVLEYVPNKTSGNAEQVKVRVPLNPTALQLINKYKGVDKKGRLFPFIAAQNYNEHIKVVFRKCGVTRIVQVRNPRTGKYESKQICDIASSHMARRTFIGVGYKLTHDPNIIGKMTGHVEGSKAFTRYRDIDDEDLRSIINQI